MNSHVQQLFSISNKPSRNIIGLMSGTSLDGLDVAFCRIEGSGPDTKFTLQHFETVPYDEDFKLEVRAVFSKEEINFQKLCLLNPWIARQHGEIINKCLKIWQKTAKDVDLIASHGQTVYHAPLSLHGKRKYGNATLQIGDGDHLAMATGIITISDFRQKHIAAGGEGAPLAAYGDYLLFKDAKADVILLNIGGIANFSFLPSDLSQQKMFSTDTGPGNTLMDAWMQQNYPGKSYDENASVAKSGNVNEELLDELLKDIFFRQPLPKTTGPELFNLDYLTKAINKLQIADLKTKDIMATLNRFSARSIVDAMRSVVIDNNCEIFVSGGGMHNPMLLEYIQQAFPGISIRPTSDKNIDPDAKEAILFAVLANECIAGDQQSFPGGLNNFPNVSMGKISFPG